MDTQLITLKYTYSIENGYIILFLLERQNIRPQATLKMDYHFLFVILEFFQIQWCEEKGVFLHLMRWVSPISVFNCSVFLEFFFPFQILVLVLLKY